MSPFLKCTAAAALSVAAAAVNFGVFVIRRDAFTLRLLQLMWRRRWRHWWWPAEQGALEEAIDAMPQGGCVGALEKGGVRAAGSRLWMNLQNVPVGGQTSTASPHSPIPPPPA